MSADQLVQYLSWAIYTLIFVSVAIIAVRRPLRTNIDIALFFLMPALIIAVSLATTIGLLTRSGLLTAFTVALLLGLAYMLLRLVDDFAHVPTWLMRVAAGSLAVFVVDAVVVPGSSPVWLTMLELLYLVGFLFYGVVAFAQEASKSSGVTKRRMRAVAAGSICLCAEFIILGVQIFFPDQKSLWTTLSGLAGLASGVSYFLGFAPPGTLRRAWQEPELRAFLGRAASLPRLPNTEAIIRELEQGAANALGAPNASIGTWHETEGVLYFVVDGEQVAAHPNSTTATGRAFLGQKPVFVSDVPYETSHGKMQYAEAVRDAGIVSVLAAPVTAGERRIGVLVVYSSRSPVFADEDLNLVTLLADQAAVILESRALIDEAARVQAQAEVTRLKDDFLSAAAHALKTPLTTLVAQAQLLERKAMRAPEAPVDLGSIQKIVKESQRLKKLVLELLDANRAEQGKLIGDVAEVDLVACAEEVCERNSAGRHICRIEAASPVMGTYDETRILQLMDNLVENAVKYSPDGGEVLVKVWQEGQYNRIEVHDAGIGIPEGDIEQIFERFHRASNTNDRRFAGMGLGLFICHGIVEQHGGRIWATSKEGEGSVFHVVLPLVAHSGGSSHLKSRPLREQEGALYGV
ncbi:MAG: ATP-binding protein [Chloroflexota bacterium]|nr:ATP-binding protein [Chloroflexota bacterium]